MRTFITFLAMLSSLDNSSTYVVLPSSWAIMMNDSLRGNSRFIARQTNSGTWVTSANMVSDPNFAVAFEAVGHIYPLDTVSIPVDSFPKPDTSILK